MASSERRTKNQAMAAFLVKMGYPHGRRASSGLSGIPVNEPGSAAYRRLVNRNKRGGSRG